MKLRVPHCTVAAVLALLTGGSGLAQTTAAHTFHVFLRGNDVGTEEVTVLESPEGWTLRGSARFAAPLNLTIEYWEARYDRGWKALELTVKVRAQVCKNTCIWETHELKVPVNISKEEKAALRKAEREAADPTPDEKETTGQG